MHQPLLRAVMTTKQHAPATPRHPVPESYVQPVCTNCREPLPELSTAPETVILIVTSRCNLRCPSCNYWKSPANTKQELTLDEYVGLLEELAEKGTRKVVLTGGEPTLRKDWKELLYACSSSMQEVLLLTNGTGLDADAHAALACTENVRIVLSWDGWNPESFDESVGKAGMYDRILGGIQRICSSTQLDGRIGINITITPQNLMHLPDIATRMADVGVDFFHFHLVYSDDPTYSFTEESCNIMPGIMQQTREKLRKIGIEAIIDHVPYAFIHNERCFIPYSHSTIGPQGDVFGCIPAKGGFKDIADNALGNLRLTSFSSIWNSSTYMNFRCDAASGRHRNCIACLACHAARNFSAGPCRTCTSRPHIVPSTPEFY